MYSVKARVEETPPLETFDVVHDLFGAGKEEVYAARVFRICSDGAEKTVALLDHVLARTEPSFVCEGERLTAVLYDAIVRLDLASGGLLQRQPCGDTGGIFAIYPAPKGYILWAERGVYCYDADLKKRWEFSGEDIMAARDGKESFRLEKDRIVCCDFSGRRYVLSLAGALLEETAL